MAAARQRARARGCARPAAERRFRRERFQALRAERQTGGHTMWMRAQKILLYNAYRNTKEGAHGRLLPRMVCSGRPSRALSVSTRQGARLAADVDDACCAFCSADEDWRRGLHGSCHSAPHAAPHSASHSAPHSEGSCAVRLHDEDAVAAAPSSLEMESDSRLTLRAHRPPVVRISDCAERTLHGGRSQRNVPPQRNVLGRGMRSLLPLTVCGRWATSARVAAGVSASTLHRACTLPRISSGSRRGTGMVWAMLCPSPGRGTALHRSQSRNTANVTSWACRPRRRRVIYCAR
eukprot:6191135-Pleurochrysis_carterae.AAC.1